MLMSVRARRREIGIRMAVGARRNDVLRQFLVEAVAVSVLGCLLGILLCSGLLELIGRFEVPSVFLQRKYPVSYKRCLCAPEVLGWSQESSGEASMPT